MTDYAHMKLVKDYTYRIERRWHIPKNPLPKV